MSNSQEQSLDEHVVFLPVNESSPEFLHCERERQAVERLLSAGPEAFYGSVGTERSGCFLSPEEVSQITSWAQDYRVNPLQVQRERESGAEGRPETEDICSTYFPSCSDTPLPCLELGWPERSPWVPKGSVTVHTSPPAEGEAPVRELIRRHLQKASQVIAIVTDRLTDGAIIGDLHNAASRGVPVYIILNQRSIQENFTLNRLRHPNMQVRVLGGKTFCSRTGRMVVGELKDKFLLVDLETVIHGSYSLTWTDAHLHRQLITVLGGPVVDSFDREFRMLFAASLPVSDTWRFAGVHADVTHQLKDLSNLGFHKHLPLEPEITGPPSPPTDSPLDWEAMGVVQRDCCSPESPLDQPKEIVAREMPLQNNMLFDKNISIMDGFTHNGNQFVERKRLRENNSPAANKVPDRSTTFNNTRPSPTDQTTPETRKSVERIIEKTLSRQLSMEKGADSDARTAIRLDDKATELTTPEIRKSVERIIEKTLSRQLSIEKGADSDARTAIRLDDKATEPTHHMVLLSSAKRRERSRTESILEEEGSMNESGSKVENIASSRKPLILRVPQSESFSSLSDILKRIQPQQSTSGQLKKGAKTTMSEMSQSMMDLSVHNTDTSHDERGVPVPRFKASGFDPEYLTPALSLMRKRNDDLKPLLYRTPKTYIPRERPRSSSYALNMDWRRSLAEMEGEQE